MYSIDLHTHTVASTHAYSTLHDYINVAKAKKIKLFSVTDHGPNMQDAPHRWHFVNMRIWPRVVDNIVILRGIEANIKNIAGETDCDSVMRKSLDIVIAGFHESVFTPYQDVKTNTQAMIAAIASRSIHIISHPGNPKFPINILEVAEAAAHYKVALEINNSSFLTSRKGSSKNCIKVAETVKNVGGLISLGSDSHIAFTLGNFNECEKILSTMDFPEERILNSSSKKLLTFLEEHGQKINI